MDAVDGGGSASGAGKASEARASGEAERKGRESNDGNSPKLLEGFHCIKGRLNSIIVIRISN